MTYITRKLTYACKVMAAMFVLLPFIGIVNFNRVIGFERYAFFSTTCFMLYKIFVILISLCVAVVAFRKKEITKTCAYIFFLYLFILIRGIVAECPDKKNIITVIVMLFFFEYCVIHIPERLCLFIDAINVFLILNFISVLMFIGNKGLVYWSVRQNRYWHFNYLLGYDNTFIILVLPMICLNLVMLKKTGKKKYWFSAAIGIATEIIIFSASSMLALIVFGLVYNLWSNKYIAKLFMNPVSFMTSYLFVFVILVIFQSIEMINRISVSLFGKTLETTRINLWNEGISKISDSFLLGYGYNVMTIGGIYQSPHNLILEFLLQGGIVQLSIFACLIFYVLKRLSLYKDAYVAKIFFSGITAFLVAYITESYSVNYSFWFFMIFILICGNESVFSEEAHDLYLAKHKAKRVKVVFY